MNDEIDIVQNDDGSIMISVGGGTIHLFNAAEAKELYEKLGKFNDLAYGGFVDGTSKSFLVGEQSPKYVETKRK